MADSRPVRRSDRALPVGRGTHQRGESRATGGARRRPAPPPRVPWSRRVGVAVGLIAVTGTIALAGSGVLEPGDDPSRPAGVSPAATLVSAAASVASVSPPTITAPADGVTREEAVNVRVELNDTIAGRHSVRIYRDDRVVAEARTRDETTVEIADVPLRRGDNSLSATVDGPLGESSPSAAVVITRDDTPPPLTVTEPLPGAVVNAPTVVIRGISEAGAAITVEHASPSASVQVSASADGSYEATVELASGANQLVVAATDAAGNLTTAGLLVTRGDGRTEARLDLSLSLFRIPRLPAPISLRVVVVDADGVVVDGAAVVFSISPPGLPTETYRTITVRGEASWLNVSLPRDGARPGEGFATALVTLADGTTVRAITPFEFR